MAQMNQLAYQLDEMADDPDQIPALYSQFKEDVYKRQTANFALCQSKKGG